MDENWLLSGTFTHVSEYQDAVLYRLHETRCLDFFVLGVLL